MTTVRHMSPTPVNNGTVLAVIANLSIGIGVVIALLSLPAMIMPIIGIPILVVGGSLIQIGRLLRQKARQLTVQHQMGG
jgi:hypothetical protein